VNRRRVVITGIGPITPIGTTTAGLWSGLQGQRSAVRSLTRFDPSQFRSHNAAEIDDFVPTDHLEAKRAKRFDRFAQFSVVGAQMALADANLDLSRENRERVGANMGTALGGVAYAESQLAVFLQRGLREVDASLALAVFGGASSCNIAIELGVMGPNSTNAMSCASGTIAIGDAFRQIRDGYADVMIAGGAEAPLAPLCFGAFSLIRAMSTRNEDPGVASRPFDKDRDGFVMGEGAGIVVLEEYEHAKARGAKIYAEVIGYGLSGDAYHITSPSEDGDGAYRCMAAALKRAGIDVSEIDYVNAHGTSTPLGDELELKAVERIMGNAAGKLSMSSTKSAIGHLLGAAGAVEAIFSILAMRDGIIPPTINLDNPSVETAIDLVPKQAKRKEINVVLSNSFGFGGTNASIILRRVS
jgi:3-oxoacyl-[acyl-carrier-protein] synthase II